MLLIYSVLFGYVNSFFPWFYWTKKKQCVLPLTSTSWKHQGDNLVALLQRWSWLKEFRAVGIICMVCLSMYDLLTPPGIKGLISSEVTKMTGVKKLQAQLKWTHSHIPFNNFVETGNIFCLISRSVFFQNPFSFFPKPIST